MKLTVSLAGVLACLLHGSYVGAKHVTRVCAEREAYAESLSDEEAGLFFNASGFVDTTLDVGTYPPSVVACDALLAAITTNRRFASDLIDHGFREVDCEAGAQRKGNRLASENLVAHR